MYEFLLVVCAITPLGMDVDVSKVTAESVSECQDRAEIVYLDTEDNPDYLVVHSECVRMKD